MEDTYSVYDSKRIARYLYQVFFEQKKAFPLRLTLGLTKRCNLHCHFCWRVNFRRKKCEELDDKFLLSLIEEAAMLGVKLFHIIGDGEPMVRRELCLALMKKAKRLGLQGTLITNGTLFDQNSIRQIIHYGWEDIVISLDASYAELHDYLRGRAGSFAKIIETITEFQRMKKQYNFAFPRIIINFLITSLNFKNIPEMLSLMNDLSLKNINFLHMQLANESARFLMLTEAQKQELDKIITNVECDPSYQAIAHNLNCFKIKQMNKEVLTEQNKESSISCFLPWYNISITSRGYVDCCDTGMDREIKLPGYSLRKVWESSYYSNLRDKFSKGYLFEKCLHCCMRTNIAEIRKALRIFCSKDKEL